jgi:hypothetical protein
MPNPIQVGSEVGENLYSSYESEQLNNTAVSSSLRHCLSCDRYGHTALNCPAPRTAVIIANYGIYKDILQYAAVRTDPSVILGTDVFVSMDEPIDEPPVTVVPTFSPYACSIEPTLADEKDPPHSRKPRKRHKKVVNNDSDCEQENITSTANKFPEIIENANSVGMKYLIIFSSL